MEPAVASSILCSSSSRANPDFTSGPELLGSVHLRIRQRNEIGRVKEDPFANHGVHVRIEIQEISETLNGSNHGGHTVGGIGIQPVHLAHGPVGRLAELTQQGTTIPEVHPQPAGNPDGIGTGGAARPRILGR